MVSTLTKRGRPAAVYRTSWGTAVPGLFRLTDGRWRITGKDKRTFTEPDERLAVARFHAMTSGSTTGPMLEIPVAVADMNDTDAVRRALQAVGIGPAEVPTPIANPFEPSAPIKQSPNTKPIRIEADGDLMTFYDGLIQQPAFGAWLRKMILTKPQLLAEISGVEQMGYLSEVKKPTPSLPLAQAIEVYVSFAKVSKDEHSRIRRLWEEFTKVTGVTTVKQIDHDVVEQYEKAIMSQGLAPKTTKHRFSGVRTVLAFCMKRGKSVQDCRAALDALSMLTVDDANPLDPRPISVADFWGIHHAAVKAGDKAFAAMLMLSLNGAFYSSEVAVLKWSDIDLKRAELAVRRRKTTVPRVACLWPETVAALKALPRHEHSDRLFHAARGPLYRQAISRLWTTYKDAAGIKEKVVFSQLRDASFTIAARVDIDAARLLNGHKLAGAADAYVLRQPQAVREVCEAIRAEFKVKQNAK